MIAHTNRGRLFVEVGDKWRLYTNTIPEGSEAIGVITRGEIGDIGALVRLTSGAYVQINAGVMRSLDGRKVSAALGTAGRPQEMAGGKRVNTYLDADSLEIAAQLGAGNVSEGIRKAIRHSAATVCVKCWHPRGADWLDGGETCPVCKTVG